MSVKRSAYAGRKNLCVCDLSVSSAKPLCVGQPFMVHVRPDGRLHSVGKARAASHQRLD